MARGIGLAVDRLVPGVVDPAQLDRIDAERVAELVQGALQREQVGRLGRAAHEPGGLAVELDHADLGQDVRAGIEPRRRGRAGDVVRRGPRRGFPAFVRQGLKLAVLARSQPEPVLRLRPKGDDAEALLPSGLQTHRPVQPPGGDGDPGGAMGEATARAEGAADETRDAAHVSGIGFDLLGQGGLQSVGELRPLVDGELAVPPLAGGGVELQWIVVLRRGRIALVDGHCRLRQRGLGVADLGVVVPFLRPSPSAALAGVQGQGLGARTAEAC